MNLINLLEDSYAVVVDRDALVFPSVDRENDEGDTLVMLRWESEGLEYEEDFWVSNVKKVEPIDKTTIKVHLCGQTPLLLQFLNLTELQ